MPELTSGTGCDSEVAGYVLDNRAAEDFFAHLMPFLLFFIESHDRAERPSLTLAVGCTGGKHRSVAVAEKIREMLESKGVAVDLFHRDIDRA